MIFTPGRFWVITKKIRKNRSFFLNFAKMLVLFLFLCINQFHGDIIVHEKCAVG